MRKDELTEKVLNSMRSSLDDFYKEEAGIEDPIAYEERVLKLSQEFARNILSSKNDSKRGKNSKKKY